MKELTCKILDVYQSPWGDETITYGVFDGDKQVAQGVSSSLSWVKNDAGGYHTKETFDKLYPDGWKVNFSF